METITLQPHMETVQSPENLKQAAFGDMTRKVLLSISLEAGDVTTFLQGGREYPIDTDAAAVKAFGQLTAKCAENVYNTTTH